MEDDSVYINDDSFVHDILFSVIGHCVIGHLLRVIGH